jgi:hypothetical protein
MAANQSIVFLDRLHAILLGLVVNDQLSPRDLSVLFSQPLAEHPTFPTQGRVDIAAAIADLSSNYTNPTSPLRTARLHASAGTENAPLVLTDSPSVHDQGPLAITPNTSATANNPNDRHRNLTAPPSTHSAASTLSPVTLASSPSAGPRAAGGNPKRAALSPLVGRTRHPFDAPLALPVAQPPTLASQRRPTLPALPPQAVEPSTVPRPAQAALEHVPRDPPPGIAPPLTLPTAINFDNLPGVSNSNSYSLPLSNINEAKLEKVWATRMNNRLVTLPLAHRSANAPTKAAAAAIWLLSADVTDLTRCYKTQKMDYQTEHRFKPTTATYATLDALLPRGFHCQATPQDLTIANLLDPQTISPDLTYHNLPWFTYPIVAEVYLLARNQERTKACQFISGYAVFHHQCRAVLSTDNHPNYTLIGMKIHDAVTTEDNTATLTAKIFPLNGGLYNTNNQPLRLLTAFVITPIEHQL